MDIIQKNNANEKAEENPMAGSGSEMAPAVMMARSQAGSRKAAMARAWRAFGLATMLGGSLSMASCHSAVTEGRSAVYLIMDSLEGGRGASGQVAEFDHTLQSDVLTNGSIFEDPGQVTLRIAFKDVTNPTGPTSNNLVTINRYRVEYRRTDGRNRQGVDVPYAFDGASTFTVGADPTQGGFILVRVQSKLEAPLITLRDLDGGGLVISTLADVTFWGRDQTGTEVSVKGTISVNFADWGDPDDGNSGSERADGAFQFETWRSFTRLTSCTAHRYLFIRPGRRSSAVPPAWPGCRWSRR